MSLTGSLSGSASAIKEKVDKVIRYGMRAAGTVGCRVTSEPVI